MDAPARPAFDLTDPTVATTTHAASNIAQALTDLHHAAFLAAGDRRHAMEQAAVTWPIMMDAIYELLYLRRAEERRFDGEAANYQDTKAPNDPAPDLTEHGELAVRCMEAEAALESTLGRLQAIAAAAGFMGDLPPDDVGAELACEQLRLIRYAAEGGNHRDTEIAEAPDERASASPRLCGDTAGEPT